MKNYSLLILLMLILLSCSGTDTKDKKHITLVENYVNAVQHLDYNLMETYLSDDYIGYGPSTNDSIGKSDAVINWKKNIDDLYEKIEYKRSRIMPVSFEDGPNKGDWVSNWAELEITYKDEGDKVVIWANTIYQIEGEKIIKSYTFYNEADALEQLGYIFINPEKL
jgi:hypothetical protein